MEPALILYRAILASYEIPKTTNLDELSNLFEQVFQGAATVMSKFLTDNPDADFSIPMNRGWIMILTGFFILLP